MEIIFEILKGFQNIPITEISSCLDSRDIQYKIKKSTENLLIISIDNKYLENVISVSKNLSLTYFVGELFFISSYDDIKIKRKASKIKINDKGSIAIKYRKRAEKINSQKIIKILADIFTKNRKVELTNPKIEIRCLFTNNYIYVYKKILEINRSEFEKRKAQFRPFFSPISLHPKLSRLMINLSKIKKNERLLDPFCGTGGILIEAGLLGYKIIGNDIEKKMIKGCKRNLNHYNIKDYKLLNYDIGELFKFLNNIDVIVTDFPYGRSTTTKGESLNKLSTRAFINIEKILNQNGRAIIGLNNIEYIKIGEKYLNLINFFSIKIHKNLTRYLTIFKKY